MLIEKNCLSGFVTLVLITLSLTFAESQEADHSLNGSIMFYNVENLFDTEDDPDKDDNDFIATGSMRWNRTRYLHKINSISKTIIAAGEWNPPAIIGLCEVENKKVLNDLVFSTVLAKYDYGIIHEDSPDPRGIDVCMLFRKDIVRILNCRSLAPVNIPAGDFHSRNVLYSKCILFGDTLHIMINHWPSRRGGVLAGEYLRKEIALMIRNFVDSLFIVSSGSSKVIIMGDFNCRPDDHVIQLLIKPTDKNSLQLINLADRLEFKEAGTYRYQGVWECLDQIIISQNLLDSSDRLLTVTGSFRIFKADFLMTDDLKYPGLTTFATFRGYRYQGGFSDHLPVLLDLGIR